MEAFRNVSRMLSDLVEKDYDTVVAELRTKHDNVDPFLLIKSAMLSRKYPKEKKQKFWLEIYYNKDADADQKRAGIYQMTGRLPSGHGHNHFTIDLQSNLEAVLSIASDEDIERIEGEVFPL